MKILNILEKRYWLILGVICLFAFATRLYKIGEVKTYIFDEVYHAITAKLITRNDVRAYEWWNPPVEPDTAVDWLHPPLAKYTQALGMKIFGETPIGWRVSSVIFGTMVILVTAEFTRYLFNDRRLGLLAAFLASLDGLLLTQSRIAMNDIHVTLMLLLTFFSYAWYRRRAAKYIASIEEHGKNHRLLADHKRAVGISLLITGICIGLALGSKWSGFFGFLTIWGFEVLFFISSLYRLAPQKRDVVKEIFARVIMIGILPFMIYVLSYAHMFAQGKTLVCDGDVPLNGQCYCNQNSSAWVQTLTALSGGNTTRWEELESRGGCKRLISHFSELHHQIWWYQTNLKATHGYQSRPLQWFLNVKPVWFYVRYEEGKTVNIYAQGNPILFWLGDIAVGASVLLLGMYGVMGLRQQFQRAHVEKPQLKQKASIRSTNPSFLRKLQLSLEQLTDFNTETGQLFFITISYFAVWLPWQLSPRIMFFYHYTPAVPLLAILLSFWLVKLSKEKFGIHLALLLVLGIVVAFVIFYPNWTGIPVPQKFADTFYFAIKSWK